MTKIWTSKRRTIELRATNRLVTANYTVGENKDRGKLEVHWMPRLGSAFHTFSGEGVSPESLVHLAEALYKLAEEAKAAEEELAESGDA